MTPDERAKRLTKRLVEPVSRDAGNLLLDEDYNIALALLDAMHLTSPDAMRLLAEIPQQGAPESAFRQWHADWCAGLLEVMHRKQLARALT